MLQIVHVTAHGRIQSVEVKRQQVRIRQPQHRGAHSLRQRAPINEPNIAEMREPVVIVVHRMINATIVFAAELQVQRSYAREVEKRRVVGSRSQRLDRPGCSGSQPLPLLARIRSGNTSQLPALPHRDIFFRVADLARDLVHKCF